MDHLAHSVEPSGRIYDPVKAHEYYMRTRQLKGRRRGTSYTVKLGGKSTRLSGQQLTEERAYAEHRVKQIVSRLQELTAKLREMMQTVQTGSHQPTQSKAAVKANKARQSKQYRQSHKQQLATKRKTAASQKPTQSKPTTADIAALEQKINEIKGSLQAAVARQRALAAATRN